MSPATTRIAKSATRKFAPALLAALAVLGVVAFTVFGAPGTVKNNPGTGVSGDATQNANKKFTLSGDLSAPLSLGGTGRPVDLVVGNPNPQTLVVSEIRVEVSGVSPSACGVSNFSVTQTSSSVTVPPRSSRPVDAAVRPRVVWVNSATQAQNHCLGADLTLSYTGKGTLR